MKDVRLRGGRLVTRSPATRSTRTSRAIRRRADVNYVFPTFVTTRMPIGLVGLIIAAIFAAAMSSIAAELNSLATATVIDVYQRLLKPTASDAHYLRVSKLGDVCLGTRSPAASPPSPSGSDR